ncbi:FAD-binding oxidoreductase [Burkholderia sp. Ax-1719]|uniref:FAD-binding oxidoreductase n=1 Tax=Burkholderia sp. Ax-1719 TaxID=2608334 RepID=UPI00141FF2D4|nr:FAD-binding oxidoreductase [Burkholderia sp. Ax-1719]NIE63184.1 FAD-binding oxidoreductase [Burkholderia sp. Ax-1719]
MPNHTAFHPLRKLINGGNPNSLTPNQDVVDPPLEAWLRQHEVSYPAFLAYQASLLSDVVTPFSGRYDTARQESDNAFNKYPLFVTYCTNVADVVSTIQFARSQHLSVVGRAGGHSTAGYSVLDNRIVIDVSQINSVFVDPVAKVATVGAGVTWGTFNHVLNAYGLHTPGGSCSTVGVTGYTLGGGYGYTSMRWGIACDHLIEVTLVTADGKIVTANEQENAELLWAHRGGTGGNFGIVVSLKYKLESLAEVWPLEINWPIEDAAKVLVTWQDQMTKTLQDTKLGLLGFLATRQNTVVQPDGERVIHNVPYFCIRGIYSGDVAAEGEKALAPLLAIGKPEFPSPLWKGRIPYSQANEHLLDNVEGVIPDAIKETKRCAYVERPLNEADYQKMVDYFKTSPSLYNIVSMEPYGGAINNVAPDATAFVHRNAYFDIFVDSFWMDEADKPEAFKWLHDYFESPETKELWSNHYYQNYPNSEYKNWQNGYFGINYQRLQQIKAHWDPTNFFHYEQSIQPA